MTTEVKQLPPPTSPLPLIFSFIYFPSINHHHISNVFFFHHNHHQHISVVLSRPPPPYFYCFPSTTTTTTIPFIQFILLLLIINIIIIRIIFIVFSKKIVISQKLISESEVNLSRKPLRILKEVAWVFVCFVLLYIYNNTAFTLLSYYWFPKTPFFNSVYVDMGLRGVRMWTF